MLPTIVHKPGLADVIERFDKPLRAGLSRQGRQVFRQIQACRTSLMGGRLLHCEQCHRHHLQYHSCRNRHCPCCGYQASQQWVHDRMQDTLPVTYHHLVFTLPHQFNTLVALHRETVYQSLFDSVWQTLKTFAADPKRLNGELGATLVMHTWTQTLTRHVHIHCLVPGGALQRSGAWQAATSTYLFPVRALSRVYRGKMVASLRKSRAALAKIENHQLDQLLDEAMGIEWNVYSKPVLTKTSTVVSYLARYTKRIGISNARLAKMDDRHVWFKYRDNREGQSKMMKLEGETLLKRFLLHILPKRFMRVRYYGYMANAHRRRKLRQIRLALQENVGETPQRTQESSPAGYKPICIKCKQPMITVKVIRSRLTMMASLNTS